MPFDDSVLREALERCVDRAELDIGDVVDVLVDDELAEFIAVLGAVPAEQAEDRDPGAGGGGNAAPGTHRLYIQDLSIWRQAQLGRGDRRFHSNRQS